MLMVLRMHLFANKVNVFEIADIVLLMSGVLVPLIKAKLSIEVWLCVKKVTVLVNGFLMKMK